MVEQTKRIKTIKALAYVENKIHSINNKFKDEKDTSGRLDITYQSGLNTSAKNDGKELVKMLRWLLKELGITTLPTAYTDAQVDAIDPSIRTVEV